MDLVKYHSVAWLKRQFTQAQEIELAYLAQRRTGRWTRQAEKMLCDVRENRKYFERELGNCPSGISSRDGVSE